MLLSVNLELKSKKQCVLDYCENVIRCLLLFCYRRKKCPKKNLQALSKRQSKNLPTVCFYIHETLFCSRIRNWNFWNMRDTNVDKPKSKVALTAIKELSDKIEAVDGASLQCQIWLLRSGGLAERFGMAGIYNPCI